VDRRHIASRLMLFGLPLSFDDCGAGEKVSTGLRTVNTRFISHINIECAAAIAGKPCSYKSNQ
jgi:hypothetical protein